MKIQINTDRNLEGHAALAAQIRVTRCRESTLGRLRDPKSHGTDTPPRGSKLNEQP